VKNTVGNRVSRKHSPADISVAAMQTLKSVTFAYVVQQDRVLAVVNSGSPDAWSCWLTRRVVLPLLEQAGGLLERTSNLARRIPSESRQELAAFEHQAAMMKTAEAFRASSVRQASATAAELIERLCITDQGDDFRFELRGLAGGGAAGVVRRAELHRILQMLRDEVAKARWADQPGRLEPAVERLGAKH
jgi:hypothetical protein